MLVACHKGESVSHTMTGITYGGVSLTAGHEITHSNGHMHVCSWYIDNYTDFIGRSGNSLDFTGGTLGTGDGQYRAVVWWILHPTHTVVRTAQDKVQRDVVQTQQIVLAANPGAGVDALGIVLMTHDDYSHGDCAGLGQTYQYHNTTIAVTAGDDYHMTGANEAITGSHNMGCDSSAGNNPNGVLITNAWTEGTLVPSAKIPRIFIFG